MKYAEILTNNFQLKGCLLRRRFKNRNTWERHSKFYRHKVWVMTFYMFPEQGLNCLRFPYRKAGPGELSLHCVGPTGKTAYCELNDHQDGTFTLNLKPQVCFSNFKIELKRKWNIKINFNRNLAVTNSQFVTGVFMYRGLLSRFELLVPPILRELKFMDLELNMEFLLSISLGTK